MQGFFNQYTSAVHPLLPCILPAPCQKGICAAVQRARSGNQGISFPGSINASTGTREVIRTSSQGRKGPSPSAKTHTYVRLKWSQPQLPARSPRFCEHGNYPAARKIKLFSFAKGCPSKHRAIFTACFFSHQLLLPLKAKKQLNKGVWMPSVTMFLCPGRERRPRCWAARA